MHAQAAPAAFAQAAADAAAAARGAPPPVAARGSGLTSTRQPLTVCALLRRVACAAWGTRPAAGIMPEAACARARLAALRTRARVLGAHACPARAQALQAPHSLAYHPKHNPHITPGGDEAKSAAAARRRAHLEAALAALRGVVDAHARLAALLASRSALQPLLNCIEPACRRARPLRAQHRQGTGSGNDRPCGRQGRNIYLTLPYARAASISRSPAPAAVPPSVMREGLHGATVPLLVRAGACIPRRPAPATRAPARRRRARRRARPRAQRPATARARRRRPRTRPRARTPRSARTRSTLRRRRSRCSCGSLRTQARSRRALRPACSASLCCS